jgi:hypothetical protein
MILLSIIMRRIKQHESQEVPIFYMASLLAYLIPDPQVIEELVIMYTGGNVWKSCKYDCIPVPIRSQIVIAPIT